MAGVITIPIPLHARDGTTRAYAVVDSIDAVEAGRRWSLDSHGYAVRTVYLGYENGKQRQRKIYLHRELMGLTVGDGREVDHVDGDKLNCRRSNLRVGTHTQNAQNVAARGGTSRHRGVSWQRRASGGVWQVKARFAGRLRHIGYFDQEEDAAEAASEFRRRYMPRSNETRSVAA